MPFKATGDPGDLTVVDEWDEGVGWMPHPEETMQRASHAIVVDGDVWVIDPVDAPGVDDLLTGLGEVVGVVVLLDRHQRDADAFAQRFDVPVYLPPYIDREFDAPVERLGVRLPETTVRVLHTVDLPFWQEGALFDGETLIVADALGTVEYFVVRPERIGVHPMLRPVPPTTLRDLTPARILTGHGEGVFEDAECALARAIDGSRNRLPQAWLKSLRSLV
ncbi:Metallo-beta-lactamase superfamily enzyme [Halanaeroarchaeum sp. HSR-CO]|uniref:hypothetical protein n=1 Tax=Halanaeroarchaeum sp. HSR-CO TaxID=2866382 RepID=UPI00217E79B8|nr:hypothetical protein [Halanaeroarchaeum sp. HSR-CO]UWG48094.1 Metallo-beta-lactamase superfamily enzyme [Halanaeroarchaeum sp. HSR-CO]